MREQLERQRRIIKGIFGGSMKIDSTKDFERIFEDVPESPTLYRAFADLLVKEKAFEAGAIAYKNATRLFLDSGSILQAIVSQTLAWRLARPTAEEFRGFHSRITQCKAEDNPTNQFFQRMRWSELFSFLQCAERSRLRSAKVVKKFGDRESHLYFVVSGVLKESVYHPVDGQEGDYRKKSFSLMKNDFFGKVYPFREVIISRSDVETVSRAEVLKIPGQRLLEVCVRHPGIELYLIDLYERKVELEGSGGSYRVRKTARHRLPTRADIGFLLEEGNGKWPLILSGVTRDISLSGACVVVGTKYLVGTPADMIGKNVKITLSLPKTTESPYIEGRIIWGEGALKGKEERAIFGLEFKELSETDRVLLQDYCYGGSAEQNLLWSLWESEKKGDTYIQ
ncbi:MAG: PilZ domain-containing protein [Deltaproteobacteria bacterium]|nr:PilZ domain-containing protein [Deltaproteobacteria bacterium]